MDVLAGDLCPDKSASSKCPTLASLVSLLDKIPVLLWTTDSEPRFTSLTGAGLHASAVQTTSYAGKEIETLFPRSQTGQSALYAHRKALQGVASSFDVEVSGRHLEAHVEPLRAPEGAVLGVVGLALDATERLVAEKALRISEQSYRSLIEEAPYAICRATESGQLLQANRAMLEMLGYRPGSEADLLERDLPLIFVSPEGFDTFRKALCHGSTVQGLESAWLRRDGQEIQVRVGGRAIRDPAGEILYFDLLAENVTERKELEARLQHAQKMQAIGQLAGGIAHDFNNLLTVINGYCDLLLLNQSEDGVEKRSLLLVRQAGERATSLTRQLLTFSRKQISQPQPIQLNSAVAEVVQLSRRLIGENIALTETLDPAAGLVLADTAQMNQMVMNLVINARDAMAAGGRLHIATCSAEVDLELAERLDLAPGKYAVLTVSDTGIGMDDNVRAHLFEPFFTTKPAGEGTGLGLATVYGIVRQGRGAIEVDSRAGAGTTFRIYLPHLVAENGLSESTPQPQGLVRGASTILVVEDESAVRQFAIEVLADSGYDVLEAANADEALALARQHERPIHLLLTDMVMPGLHGRELAERLREVHPESRVLLVSGYSKTLVADNTLDAGIHYLHKPFTPDQLTRTVSEVLSRTD